MILIYTCKSEDCPNFKVFRFTEKGEKWLYRNGLPHRMTCGKCGGTIILSDHKDVKMNLLMFKDIT